MPAIIDECYLVRFTIGSVATAQITHTHTHRQIQKRIEKKTIDITNLTAKLLKITIEQLKIVAG